MEKNKYIGVCKVGEKGQIVIPKEIRNMFDIKAGDSVVVLSDKEKGIAILPKSKQRDCIKHIFKEIEE